MPKLNYQSLINKDKYQVFLFKSKASFPFFFAIHPWFILNKKGEISRWEIIHTDTYNEVTHWGHLYKNRFPLFQGIGKILPFNNTLTSRSRLIGSIEGEGVFKMINFIENSYSNYPYCNTYKLVHGPNSNTYAEWVIRNFPDSNLKLPWNAFGKNYEYKVEK